MTRHIELRYMCKCSKKEQLVYVPERSQDEEVPDFLERIRADVREHHRVNSPQCVSKKMEYLAIPMPHDRLGESQGGTA